MSPHPPPQPRETAEEPDTLFLIPHTHWEGAVFKTREEYLQIGLPHILQALGLLRRYPNYRFVLDQACYVQPFLERYPEQAAVFRQFVGEGRLGIVGGTDVMLDVNMPGGESFVRQVLYGKGYFRRALGVEVTASWQLDTFGHHAQMPQLLKLAGYTSFWFARGVPAQDTPAEFLWEGLDGSRIPAFWLPYSYVMGYGSPASLPEFTAFFAERYARLAPNAAGPIRVVLCGADVSGPEDHLAPLVAEFNRQPEAPFHLRLALPADFEAAVAACPERPVVRGELNPIFPGTYSSRIELKQRMRELEGLLLTAEKLGVLLRLLDVPADDAVLCQAWEPVLFNQAHDLMSGVMTDRVYLDTLRGLDFSLRLVTAEMQTRLRGLCAALDTTGEGTPLVVFNPLGWPRSDLVTVEVGFSEAGVYSVGVIGSDGQPVPVQLLAAQRHADGSLLQAKIAFVAREVPAVGYAVYHLLPRGERPDPAASPTELAEEAILENEYYRVTVDAGSGAITALLLKEAGWNALSAPGNVVACEEDRGDLWELYRPLAAGQAVPTGERHPAPQPGQAILSTDGPGPSGTVISGPVVSEFTVTHPFGESGRFSTRIRFYAGLRRLDLRTTILNNQEFVRYRVLFPTSLPEATAVHEIPFGALTRSDGIEFPAQNWIDYGDGRRGLALLNRGLPGNNVADGVMMLSLLRSTRIVAYGYGGGYEPGMSSDSGLELDQELTFDYALLPHGGDWRQAGVYREGLAFNHPLIAVKAEAHAGPLPPRWGLLEITPPNVVLSCLKQGEDDTAILRVYEATGEAARGGSLRFSVSVTSAEEVNLMEEAGRQLLVRDDSVTFDLAPFEIKTFRLRLGKLVA
jgi:alpha-mannosidase